MSESTITFTGPSPQKMRELERKMETEGQCKPMKESNTAILLGTYTEHLSELQAQLGRVESFNNRMSGAVPQGEDGPDAVPPTSTLSRFEELNTQLRELITKLANEAARLEEIG